LQEHALALTWPSDLLIKNEGNQRARIKSGCFFFVWGRLGFWLGPKNISTNTPPGYRYTSLSPSFLLPLISVCTPLFFFIYLFYFIYLLHYFNLRHLFYFKNKENGKKIIITKHKKKITHPH
jgi:hypothetical protein